MNNLPFAKMSGCGNDFIVIDNRGQRIPRPQQSRFAEKVCRRRMSVGADGVILIERSQQVDFKWRFYNADGSEAEMCGNGARCAARFACLKDIAPKNLSFETISGIISAYVTPEHVRIGMTDPGRLEAGICVDLEAGALTLDSIDTGVPHAVACVADAEEIDVVERGREIRHHRRFQPAGTNVNFISRNPDGTIRVRTYERGVEDETLACGTGAVAAAIVAGIRFPSIETPVRVMTSSGGILTVLYDKDGSNYRNVFLQGEARVVYEGVLWDEALL